MTGEMHKLLLGLCIHFIEWHRVDVYLTILSTA